MSAPSLTPQHTGAGSTPCLCCSPQRRSSSAKGRYGFHYQSEKYSSHALMLQSPPPGITSYVGILIASLLSLIKPAGAVGMSCWRCCAVVPHLFVREDLGGSGMMVSVSCYTSDYVSLVGHCDLLLPVSEASNNALLCLCSPQMEHVRLLLEMQSSCQCRLQSKGTRSLSRKTAEN